MEAMPLSLEYGTREILHTCSADALWDPAVEIPVKGLSWSAKLSPEPLREGEGTHTQGDLYTLAWE